MGILKPILVEQKPQSILYFHTLPKVSKKQTRFFNFDGMTHRLISFRGEHVIQFLLKYFSSSVYELN